jgi:hypothetical protein
MRPFVAGMLLLLAMENNLDAKHMDSDSGPVSRAERTGYTETSTYADVMEFIGELQRKDAAVKLEYFATTPQGRKLPLVILSKPSVTSPLDAAASGKPVVFVMANIHAGEVEGKEAMLHLMRDVSTGNLFFWLRPSITPTATTRSISTTAPNRTGQSEALAPGRTRPAWISTAIS